MNRAASFRLRTAVCVSLTAVCSVFFQNAHAAHCDGGHEVKVTGDVPAAISYDVFSRLHPVVAERVAGFTSTQQVKMLHDGTVACVVKDDGVTDPSAVLLRIPGEPVNYWVRSWNVVSTRGH